MTARSPIRSCIQTSYIFAVSICFCSVIDLLNKPSAAHTSFLYYLSVTALTTLTAMHFSSCSPSLPLLLPFQKANIKRQTSCTSQAWEIQDYHTCTNCSFPGATQEITSLVFKFEDPNFNPAVTATCELSVLPGSSLINFDYTPCGSGVAFHYDGDSLKVERTGIGCEK